MERGELIAGRYELGNRLGRGGMGEVWAARDRVLRREVAVKMLVLDEAVHPDLPRRFEREAVAAAQINHPNVVGLYDRGVHEDRWFLVMERIKGTDLAEEIRRGEPVDPARALALAEGICAALVAAHRAGVVHYDIKPHNIMITPEGGIKVVDFGIAGFIRSSYTLGSSSQLAPAGTPEYGAPEQFLTEGGDARCDLYALGSVLFALLAGRPPFTGQTGFAIMQRKLSEDAPHLDTLRPGLPAALTGLVAELLDREPDRRPQTAQAVQERLSLLRTSEGSSPGTTATATRLLGTLPPATDHSVASPDQPRGALARRTTAQIVSAVAVAALLPAAVVLQIHLSDRASNGAHAQGPEQASTSPPTTASASSAPTPRFITHPNVCAYLIERPELLQPLIPQPKLSSEYRPMDSCEWISASDGPDDGELRTIHVDAPPGAIPGGCPTDGERLPGIGDEAYISDESEHDTLGWYNRNVRVLYRINDLYVCIRDVAASRKPLPPSPRNAVIEVARATALWAKQTPAG
ncbi:serine/threonine-protein kinase [Streptomyces vinaceus]|uniref:serine/threonine-protein kinase n=1 Tax=Streptomyces vinaceus TaxID=1960 RepID=UPI0035D83871